MQTNTASVKKIAIQFLKNNFIVIILFVFLLVAGIAAGITAIKTVYPNAAAGMIRDLLSTTSLTTQPIAGVSILTILLDVTSIAMLFLSGIWLPAMILFPFCIVIKGFAMGGLLYACTMAFPCAAAWMLLVVLLFDAALSLPCLLRLCALATHQFIRMIKDHTQIPSTKQYLRKGLRCALGLLPCTIVKGFVLPLLVCIIA